MAHAQRWTLQFRDLDPAAVVSLPSLRVAHVGASGLAPATHRLHGQAFVFIRPLVDEMGVRKFTHRRTAGFQAQMLGCNECVPHGFRAGPPARRASSVTFPSGDIFALPVSSWRLAATVSATSATQLWRDLLALRRAEITAARGRHEGNSRTQCSHSEQKKGSTPRREPFSICAVTAHPASPAV